MNESGDKEIDVLLSFAGSERDYARAIHDIASANGLRVFLDEEFQHEIWGKNLVEYLDGTYRTRGGYVLVLISAAYRERAFTRVERRAAFDRMIRESSEYVLPVRHLIELK
ncbi:MAG: TIR domain-containing protein [Gammaproteobacteria bacterium]